MRPGREGVRGNAKINEKASSMGGVTVLCKKGKEDEKRFQDSLSRLHYVLLRLHDECQESEGLCLRSVLALRRSQQKSDDARS